MTHRRRNLMLRVLGIGLTLGVIALDGLDVLAPPGNRVYGRRAALLPEFSPPPTRDLVHVDIDDSALEAIGAWPWPRSTLADIVDELHAAGARAVALDVVFSEAQPQHDARFARSISAARNVLIPASFTPDAPLPPSPAQQAATTVLAGDLELGWESVAAQLRDRHPALSEHEFLAARAQAILQRTIEARRAGCRSIEELRKHILPQTPLAGSSLSRVVDAT